MRIAMIKMWWKSRTIWSGVFAIVVGIMTLTDYLPKDVEDALTLASIINGALVIYFRKTTTSGIGAVLSDNRMTGSRLP